MIRRKKNIVVETTAFSSEKEEIVLSDEETSVKLSFLDILKAKLFVDNMDMFTFVSTVVNVVTSVIWILVYIFTVMYRNSVFGSIEISAGALIPTYTVIFSTPLLGVLRFFVYLMPIVYIVWTVAVVSSAKRRKKLCHSALLYTAIAIDFVVACITLFDLAAANLIFGVLA